MKNIVFSEESVAKAINKFDRNDSNVFLLYESPLQREYLSSEIQHVLLGESDLIDRFDFDNPSVLLEVDSSYQIEEEPKEGLESEQLEEDTPETSVSSLSFFVSFHHQTLYPTASSFA